MATKGRTNTKPKAKPCAKFEKGSKRYKRCMIREQKKDPYAGEKTVKGVPVSYKTPTKEEYNKMTKKHKKYHRSKALKHTLNKIEHHVNTKQDKVPTLPMRKVTKTKNK